MENKEEMETPRRRGCFAHVLRDAAAKIVTACAVEEGEVVPLEDMTDLDMMRKGIGLYCKLMQAAEEYMGCQRKKGAVMCLKQEDEGLLGTDKNEGSRSEDIRQK